MRHSSHHLAGRLGRLRFEASQYGPEEIVQRYGQDSKSD
jgi:hypothetical protein